MDEITQALEPFNQYDACNSCGKRTDGLMTCYYSHDDTTIKLCPDCMEDSGFCYGCGHYSAGIESFDFSENPGYCADCAEEMNTNDLDIDDEIDYLPFD